MKWDDGVVRSTWCYILLILNFILIDYQYNTKKHQEMFVEVRPCVSKEAPITGHPTLGQSKGAWENVPYTIFRELTKHSIQFLAPCCPPTLALAGLLLRNLGK